MSVAVGDTVLVPEYGGTKLTFDEQVLHLYIVFAHASACWCSVVHAVCACDV